MKIIKPNIGAIHEISDLRKALLENIEEYEIREKYIKNNEDENLGVEKFEFRNCMFENCKYIQSILKMHIFQILYSKIVIFQILILVKQALIR